MSFPASDEGLRVGVKGKFYTDFDEMEKVVDRQVYDKKEIEQEILDGTEYVPTEEECEEFGEAIGKPCDIYANPGNSPDNETPDTTQDRPFYKSTETTETSRTNGFGGSVVVDYEVPNTDLTLGLEAGLMAMITDTKQRTDKYDIKDNKTEVEHDPETSTDLSFNIKGCAGLKVGDNSAIKVCGGYDTVNGPQAGLGMTIGL